jgi:hypothetical protein
LPFVVLLEQQRADEPRDRGFVGEDANDVGAPLDLGVEPLLSRDDLDESARRSTWRSVIATDGACRY